MDERTEQQINTFIPRLNELKGLKIRIYTKTFNRNAVQGILRDYNTYFVNIETRVSVISIAMKEIRMIEVFSKDLQQ